jgi:hypothetical protein
MKLALPVLLVAGSLAAQTTRIVDSGNPNAFPTLAAAIAAASDGDTIRIQHASEWMIASLLLDKSLRIVGDSPPASGGATTLVFFNGGGLNVSLAAGKELVIANCTLTAHSPQWLPTAAVTISGSAGRVLLQDLPASYFGIAISNSANVVLSRVQMMLANAMQVANSTVVCDRCTLTGRPGNYQTNEPSVAAMALDHAVVHCVDTQLRGGNAATYIGGWVTALPGSRALTATASLVTMNGPSTLVAAGSLWTAAPIASTQSVFVFGPGIGSPISGTSVTASIALPTVEATGFASGQQATLTVRSPWGSPTGLLFGAPGDRSTVTGVLGDLWIDPQELCAPVAGIQNGSLSWSVALPPSPAVFGRAWRWQGIALLPGAVALGPPGSAVLR